MAVIVSYGLILAASIFIGLIVTVIGIFVGHIILGVRVHMENEYSKLPIGEFGWDGAAESYAMIDPVNRVSIMYTQHILYHLTTFCKYQMILRELIYEALEL